MGLCLGGSGGGGGEQSFYLVTSYNCTQGANQGLFFVVVARGTRPIILN